MRKLIWGCTALTVAAAMGIYYAADYAAQYPDSVVGRCANAADHVGRALNPFAVLSQLADEYTAAQRRRETPPAHEDGGEECIFVPKEAEQPAPDATEGDAVEVIQVAPTLDPRAIAESFGVRLPGRTQQSAEEGCEGETKPATTQETAEPTEYGLIPFEEETEKVTTAAGTVPEDVVMPYADDEEEAPAGAGEEETSDYTKHFPTYMPESPPYPTTTDPIPTEEPVAEEKPASETDEPTEAEKQDADAEAQAEAERQSYHHQHEGCPYLNGTSSYNNGMHYCPSYCPPQADTAEPAAPSKSPMPAKKKKKKKPAADNVQTETPPPSQDKVKISHPDIDTLEYRPSDGDPYAASGRWF